MYNELRWMTFTYFTCNWATASLLLGKFATPIVAGSSKKLNRESTANFLIPVQVVDLKQHTRIFQPSILRHSNSVQGL